VLAQLAQFGVVFFSEWAEWDQGFRWREKAGAACSANHSHFLSISTTSCRPSDQVQTSTAHSWFDRFRKLLVRYPKTRRSYLALTMLAAAIICFRHVPTRVNIIYGKILSRNFYI